MNSREGEEHDGQSRSKDFSAPEPLATPTGLSPEVVQKITEAINSLVADAFALYVKTKNYPWHLSGARFRGIHLLLEEQTEAIFATADPLAVRVRRVGGTTIRSISHVNELQTISDDNEEFVDPDDMIRILMEDNKHIAAQQRKAHSVCDENGDAGTAGRRPSTGREHETPTRGGGI